MNASRKLGRLSGLPLLVAGFILAAAGAALAYVSVTALYAPTNYAVAQAAGLSAPTAATATVNGSASITVGWTLPGSQLSGAQYRVTRTSGPGSPVTVCTVASTVTSCPDTGLTAGTTYGYSVAAILGTSWQSSAITASATTLAVTTTGLPGGDVGAPYSVTLGATGGTGTYSSWALASGTLPSWATLNTVTGTISGTPTAAVTTSGLTFTVTDSHGASATSSSLSLVISPALSVSTASLPGWDATASGYSKTLAAAGGAGTYTWAQTSGTLPAGLTLSSGVISGTPTTAGTTTGLVFRVTDANGVTANSASLSIVISPALSVTTASLPGWDATASGYSKTLAATGGAGTYTWAQTSGTLPAGLTLSSGLISGTPTTAATTNGLIFTVTDSNGVTASSSSLSLVISPALSVSTASLPGWDATGPGYSKTLAAAGGTGTYTWAQTSGTLPAGLTLSSGLISGTPTTAGTTTGLIFRVTDANGVTASSSSLSLVISPALSVSTANLPGWDATAPGYSKTLAAAGGTGTYTTWASTGTTLPAGLSLNSGTGAITGTPTTAVTTNGLIFTVTDSNGVTASSSSLSLVISPALSVSTASLPNGTVDAAYSSALTAAGGTGTYTTWASTGGTLPAGLSLNSGTGAITGTPTTAATTNGLIFTVTDSNGVTASSGSLTVTVAAAANLTITNVVRDSGNHKHDFSGTGGSAGATVTVSVCATNNFPSCTAVTTATATVAADGTWTTGQSSSNITGGATYFARAVQGTPAKTSPVFQFIAP